MLPSYIDGAAKHLLFYYWHARHIYYSKRRAPSGAKFAESDLTPRKGAANASECGEDMSCSPVTSLLPTPSSHPHVPLVGGGGADIGAV